MSRFLKNRSFAVKVLKDEDINGGAPDNDPNRNPFEGVEIAAAYAEVAKEFVTHAALTIGGVWAACKIVERICR
jgi:hypothetical protein